MSLNAGGVRKEPKYPGGAAIPSLIRTAQLFRWKKFWNFSRQSSIYYYQGFVRKTAEHDIFLCASGIAFNGLICLVPVLLLITSILGIVINSSTTAMTQINVFLLNLFPEAFYSSKLRQGILSLINELTFHRRSLGLIGTLTLAWTTTSMFGAARTVLNSIYGTAKRVKFFYNHLHDLIAVIIIGIFFIAMNLFTWLISFLKESNFFFLRRGSLEYLVLNTVVENIIGFVLTVMTFWFIFRFIPSERQSSRVLIVSSVTTGILWEITGRLFSHLVMTYHFFSSVYGAYTFLIVALFWVYYTGIIFVIGALIGQLYKERNAER